MRGWLRGALIVAAAAAACKFTPSQATQDAGPKPDAGPCQELGATCADAMTRRACTVVGAMPIDTTCSWGCLGETAHCGVLVPTGSGVTVNDVTDESQLGDVTIDDEDIDGGDGSIMHGGTVLRAPGIGIISGIDFKIVNGYSVFRARNWTITNHDINADGPNPIAIVATRDISIDHLLDVRGSCANGASGPGGFPAVVGGGSDGVGSGGGKGGGNQDSNGGGGGGHGAAGGVGGGALAAAGGTPFGDPLLATLVGGGAGGNGADGVTGLGGGGGGAVQLVANGSISIIGGGNIDASGCGGTHGGDGGNGNDSGGGGGAGGAILLEAHDLAIAGTLTVNGGGGGAGGGGMSGSRGTQNRTPAQGGTGGQGSGGSGAAGSATTGFTGVTGTHSGGGGGGVGIMRLNSWSGSATVDPTKLSPNFDDPQTTTSQGSAHVQ